MKITRSGARASSPEASVNLKNLRIKTKGENGELEIILNDYDVADFGTNKTHHNYHIEISIEEFMEMVSALAECNETTLVAEKLSPKLNKLVKLVNICAT